MRIFIPVALPVDHPFLQNKYTQWYYAIIEAARQRPTAGGYNGYTENHHIIPDCFYIDNRSKGKRPGWLPGNSNAQENRVQLSFEEHFVCHWLLTKIVDHSIVRKMENALQGFRRKGKNQERILSAGQYARAKLADRKAKEGKQSPRKGVPNLSSRGRQSKQKGIPNLALKGKKSPWKWWNNGVHQIRAVVPPEGYSRGRLLGIPNLKNRGPKLRERKQRRTIQKVMCNICSIPIGKSVLKRHQLSCQKTREEGIKAYNHIHSPRPIGTKFSWMHNNQILQSEVCPGEGWVRVHGLLGTKTWTDGKTQIRSIECPGEGWYLKAVRQVTNTWMRDGLLKRSIRCPGADWVLVEDI